MVYSRYDHWRDVSKDDEGRSKICALRWDFYTKYKEDLIKRFLRWIFRI